MKPATAQSRLRLDRQRITRVEVEVRKLRRDLIRLVRLSFPELWRAIADGQRNKRPKKRA